jgi:hypothetical protein
VTAGNLAASTNHLVQLVSGTGNTNTTRLFEATVPSDARGALIYRLTIDQGAGAYTVRIVAIGGTVLATAPFVVTGSGSTRPVLAITPDQGPCGIQPVMQGNGFPAGSTVTLYREQTSPAGQMVGTTEQVTQVQAGPAGDTIPFTLPPVGRDCANAGKATPEGTRFTFIAVASGPGIPAQNAPTARAVFTIRAGNAPETKYFPETGFSVAGRFLGYWRTHGLDLGDAGLSEREALALLGYPISGEFTQRLEDGKEYKVQYFERARFEFHPENVPPYDVLLGQFGRRIHPANPPVRPEAGARYFPETGHQIAGDFQRYWETNGGLAQFGYPLTEVITGRLGDGKTYAVQYFERARFEYHPENQAPYDIQLGQFGRQILGAASALR